MQFKVGDKVRVVEENAWGTIVAKGQIGTVRACNPDSYHPCYTVHMDGSTDIWSFRDDDIESADSASAPTLGSNQYFVLYSDGGSLRTRAFASQVERNAWLGTFLVDHLENRSDYDILMLFSGAIEKTNSEISLTGGAA